MQNFNTLHESYLGGKLCHEFQLVLIRISSGRVSSIRSVMVWCSRSYAMVVEVVLLLWCSKEIITFSWTLQWLGLLTESARKTPYVLRPKIVSSTSATIQLKSFLFSFYTDVRNSKNFSTPETNLTSLKDVKCTPHHSTSKSNPVAEWTEHGTFVAGVNNNNNNNIFIRYNIILVSSLEIISNYKLLRILLSVASFLSHRQCYNVHLLQLHWIGSFSVILDIDFTKKFGAFIVCDRDLEMISQNVNFINISWIEFRNL